jgi:selenocysteine-specific elongation factor
MSTHDFVLGTAGHIDHGKTTLIRALTGVDCDRLVEEKQRGITIVLGFAPIVLASGRRGGVVDVPGHERLVRTMIAGATGIDLAVVVVAADEGMMPQTREHLAILDLLGVSSGVIAVTKADLVDEELLELACDEIADGLDDTTLAGSPVIACSSVSGLGLDELRAALDRAVESLPRREVGQAFRLPVDRVFTLKGFGTIVTGTCVSGTVRRGEEVELLPGARRTRVRGIEVHGEASEQTAPSRRTAINLQGVATDEVPRGSQVVTPGRVCETSMVDLSLRYLDSAPAALAPGSHVRFLTGTAEAIGIFDPVDDSGSDDGIEPGWRGNAQIRLDRPVAVARGDQVILRRISPIVTIGGGRVIDPQPRRLRRKRRAAHARLDRALAAPDAPLGDRLLALLDDAAPAPLPAADLARRMGVPVADIRAALGTLADGGRALVLDDASAAHADVLQRYGPAIADTVDRYHREFPLRTGVPRNQLRTSLGSHVPRPLFDAVLAHTVEAADLEEFGGRLRRRGFVPEPSAAQRGPLEEIERIYRRSALAPPRVEDVRAALGAPDDFDDLLGYLRDSELLLRVTGAMLVHRDTWEDLIGRVRDRLANGGEMDPPLFKELTGLSRKHAIPFLEMLDARRVTVRVGNVRRLRES